MCPLMVQRVGIAFIAPGLSEAQPCLLFPLNFWLNVWEKGIPLSAISCWLFCPDQLETSRVSNLQGIRLLAFNVLVIAAARWPKVSHCELDDLGIKDECDEKGKHLPSTSSSVKNVRLCFVCTPLPPSVLPTASGGGAESRAVL